MTSTFKKYLLIQVPGWAVGAIVLIFLGKKFEISLMIIAGLWLFWVGKDFALYPLYRSSLEAKARTGPEQLVGSLGVARDRLDPQGYVQVGSELWKAETEQGQEPIPSGSAIRVQGTQGLKLVVTLHDGERLTTIASQQAAGSIETQDI